MASCRYLKFKKFEVLSLRFYGETKIRRESRFEIMHQPQSFPYRTCTWSQGKVSMNFTYLAWHLSSLFAETWFWILILLLMGSFDLLSMFYGCKKKSLLLHISQLVCALYCSLLFSILSHVNFPTRHRLCLSQTASFYAIETSKDDVG